MTLRGRILAPLLIAPAVAAFLMWLPAGAAVAPVNPVDGNQDFLVVVAGDAILNETDIGGSLAIGGDVTIGDIFTVDGPGSYLAPGDTTPTALLVGGGIDFGAGALGGILRVVDGYAKVGDTTGAFVRTTDNNGAPAATRVVPVDNYDATPRLELNARQSAESVRADSGIDLAALFGTYRQRSAELATCPGTVILTDASGNPLTSPIPAGTQGYITLTPGQTNVLSISAEDLNRLSELHVVNQPSAGTPLLVNVDTGGVGGVFDWITADFVGLSGAQSYVLFNFPDATQITNVSGDSIEGTVYAPSAAFIDLDPANVEGNLIVDSLTMGSTAGTGGSVRDFPFSTELSCVSPSPSASPSPSPSVSPSPSPSPSASPSASPSVSPSPSASPSPSPSASPSASPSVSPSAGPPTADPGPSPGGDPSAPPTGGPLPITGTSVAALLVAGLAATGAGLLIAVTSSYRRSRCTGSPQ